MKLRDWIVFFLMLIAGVCLVVWIAVNLKF
jgi:hypothetical protein